MNKMTKLALATSLSSMMLAASYAQAENRPASVFATTGYYEFEESGVDSAIPLTLGIGYDFSESFGLELSYTDISTDGDGSTDVDVEHITADALFYLGNDDLRPYVVAGFGDRDAEVSSGSTTVSDGETFANLGFGIKNQLADRLQLRGDIRFLRGFDSDNTDAMINVGLAFLFGGHSQGAAAKTATPAPAAPADADMDGVVDSIDSCPGTPDGVSVDASGCPLDSDGDGVADYMDQCPDTKAALKVDEKGCPLTLSETVSIDLTVTFDNNSDVVKEEFFEEIKEVADFMSQYANTNVVVEGHTDDRGAAEYNRALSEKRANAVAAVLVDRYGIDTSRVSSVGYGEAQPIASNDSAEGRNTNRRVVAKVSSEVEKMLEK